ncbi:MAG: four helix bundle protein [Deltaproteobacteria bacterium]|nr:four helix bundle protein [Deltaproteobacteria bacterium]
MMDHKKLDAWKQAISVVETIYALTKTFPKEELYGLTQQIRRAAVSVASNISEGAARQTQKEYLNFLSYSLGSVAEVETQLIIAQRLGYCRSDDIIAHVNRVRSLIIGLRNHVRTTMQ